MHTERHARLFRNGRNQAVRIPREFELPGDEVIIHKEGGRLIVEPVMKKPGLLALLATLDPLDEAFPDVDAGWAQPAGVGFAQKIHQRFAGLDAGELPVPPRRPARLPVVPKD